MKLLKKVSAIFENDNFRKCLTVIFASENAVQRHANNNTVEHKNLVIVMAMRDGSQVMLIKELGGV